MCRQRGYHLRCSAHARLHEARPRAIEWTKHVRGNQPSTPQTLIILPSPHSPSGIVPEAFVMLFLCVSAGCFSCWKRWGLSACCGPGTFWELCKKKTSDATELRRHRLCHGTTGDSRVRHGKPVHPLVFWFNVRLWLHLIMRCVHAKWKGRESQLSFLLRGTSSVSLTNSLGPPSKACTVSVTVLFQEGEDKEGTRKVHQFFQKRRGTTSTHGQLKNTKKVRQTRSSGQQITQNAANKTLARTSLVPVPTIFLHLLFMFGVSLSPPVIPPHPPPPPPAHSHPPSSSLTYVVT